MRDVGRELCPDVVEKFSKCTQEQGFKMVYACTEERNELCACIKQWLDDPDLKELVKLEYLNERSHYRETGIKTKRYLR